MDRSSRRDGRCRGDTALAEVQRLSMLRSAASTCESHARAAWTARCHPRVPAHSPSACGHPRRTAALWPHYYGKRSVAIANGPTRPATGRRARFRPWRHVPTRRCGLGVRLRVSGDAPAGSTAWLGRTSGAEGGIPQTMGPMATHFQRPGGLPSTPSTRSWPDSPGSASALWALASSRFAAARCATCGQVVRGACARAAARNGSSPPNPRPGEAADSAGVLEKWAWKVGAFFQGVSADAPDEDVRQIASLHPDLSDLLALTRFFRAALSV